MNSSSAYGTDQSDVRNMAFEAIERRHGDITTLMRGMLDRFIKSVGEDVAKRELIPYGVVLSKVEALDGCR